mgnify:FL=1
MTNIVNSYVLQLNAARSSIQQIGQSTLFAIGMIGTLLNIGIFCRRTMRHNSCALYFHANSWANFICLTWGVLASMLATFTKNNPAAYNQAYCKIRFYMINFGQYSSRAFLILACLDRFFLCSTSVRQRNFCRPKTAKLVIGLTTIICGLLTSYILVVYQPGQRLIPCSSATASAIIYETIATWLFILSIPAISMSVFSGLIIKRLRENAKRVRHDRVGRRDVQLSGMLIGQVILYLFTNVPYASFVLYGSLTQSTPTADKSAERIAIESFLNTFLASFLYYCFNGVRFLCFTRFSYHIL